MKALRVKKVRSINLKNVATHFDKKKSKGGHMKWNKIFVEIKMNLQRSILSPLFPVIYFLESSTYNLWHFHGTANDEYTWAVA